MIKVVQQQAGPRILTRPGSPMRSVAGVIQPGLQRQQNGQMVKIIPAGPGGAARVVQGVPGPPGAGARVVPLQLRPGGQPGQPGGQPGVRYGLAEFLIFILL